MIPDTGLPDYSTGARGVPTASRCVDSRCGPDSGHLRGDGVAPLIQPRRGLPLALIALAGFAVVAGQVKELVRQTAEATERCEPVIAAVREDSGLAGSSTEDKRQMSEDIQSIATTIASGVEEQSTTSREFSQHSREAGQGVASVSMNIAKVAATIGSTASGLDRVQQPGAGVSRMAAELHKLTARIQLK